MTDQNLPAAPAEPRPVRAPITTGGAVGALIPQDIEQAYRIASAFAGSGMVPASFGNKPEACFVAIMAGAEVGLPPFQAIQSFAIINGRPSMWGDALVAVIRNQGFKMKEWYVGEGDDMVAYCEITRPDNGEVTPGEFSVSDAKTAGLWKKAGPWQTNPKRMLKMRARAFAIRDGAADVLRGFSIREETEDFQPIEAATARAAPVSMRAKLPDQSGKQGFDPNHVQAETGGHDAATGEVIEGEATPTATRAGGRDEEAIQTGQQAEPGKAGQAMAGIIRTEAEAKDNLAAALASLDAKPKAEAETPADAALTEALEATGAEVVDVEIGQDGPDAAPELDSADDLIRQNAFDDGFAGEPIEAVLVMCEDEREEAVAREAFAEGQKAKIAKEAEEHAASEAAAQADLQAQAEADQAAQEAERASAAQEVEANDVAGPAPKGEKYLLATEEPAADGKLTIYQDGAVFSRIVAASAIAKYTRYDGHPEPTDPALATQSGGTATEEPKPTEPKPEPEPEKAAPAPADMKPNGLYIELAGKESWLQIKPMLTALYGSAPFKALNPEDQSATRAHLFGAVLEMKERTRDPVDWGQDPAAFSLWLDHTAAGNDPDKVAMIEGTFQTLQAGKTFKARLTPEQQNTLAVRVQAVVSKIKAGA